VYFVFSLLEADDCFLEFMHILYFKSYNAGEIVLIIQFNVME